MPSRPRVCGQPGCPNLTTNRYCPTHAHLDTGQRGSTRTWRSTRTHVINTHGLTCAICLQPVHPDDVHIDHVVTKRDGGTDDPDNLRVTHARCNLTR